MNNDYREKIREQLSMDEQAVLQALKRTSGENDEGKTLRQLSQHLHIGSTELRTILHKLQEQKLVEIAPEGHLSDGGRHYRLSMRGRALITN